MSEIQVQTAVIGGGPAGMMAAIAAARQGAHVALIDYRDRLGGNYYKEPRPVGATPLAYSAAHGQEELQAMRAALKLEGVECLQGASVWGVFQDQGPTFREGPRPVPVFNLRLQAPKPPFGVQAQTLILAPGVYDRAVPFPGWTLPGVMSPGGAQLLLENQGLLPGRRILVAGTGPLLMAVAASLAEAGAEVVALLESAGAMDGWRRGPWALWGQAKRLQEAWGYLRSLRRHRVPLLMRHAVFSAHGEQELERVVVGRLDAQGLPIRGSQRELEVDALCCAYGFLPNLSLTLHLGCEHNFDPDLRAHLPRYGPTMETSTPGVFVAGDVTGIGGKDLARLQGTLAGLGAAHRLGLLSQNDWQTEARALQPKVRNEQRFRRALWNRFRMRPGLIELIESDTVVCRCEAVRRADIQAVIERGFQDLTAIKRQTRSGMGPCQGRYCNSIVAEILARQIGVPAGTIEPMKVRPPLMPVPARDIVAGLEPDDGP